MINGKDFEGHRKQLIQGVCVCVLCFHNLLDYFKEFYEKPINLSYLLLYFLGQSVCNSFN